MTIKEWFVVWAKAARAPFLVVSALPAVAGGIIAYYHGVFDWLIFSLAAFGVVMAHSAADFIDDYFDFINGNLANKDQQFHDSPLISGKVTLKQVMFAFLLCMVLALACGAYLLVHVGQPVLVMTAIGAFIVLFYTSPPIRLNFRGLGETALFVAFGPMIVFSIYYVVTQQFSWEPLVASVPIGIFVMNVGVVSNIFDHDDDIRNAKRTLPVRIGQPSAVNFLLYVTVLAYATVVGGVVLGIFPIWMLLVLLGAPLAFQKVRLSSDFRNLDAYTPAMTKAIALASITCVLTIAAYAVAIITR